MKNIEQILKEAGIEVTDEQKAKINKGLAENYKTIADYEKQVKKTEKAEGERDILQKQYDDAQETIKGFDGIDVEKLNKNIADWKERAQKAEKDAAAQILQRDQRDFLKGEFDKLEIKSERTRESLMRDILAFSFGQMRIVAEWSCKQRLCEKRGRSHIDLSGHFLVIFLVKILFFWP